MPQHDTVAQGVTLAGAVRDVAQAAKLGVGTYLSHRQCTALAELVNARITENGVAVMYELAAINPTLSTRAAEAREAERMEVPVCSWCKHAITPSNPHDDCGPGKVSR